jgi:cytochrome c556
MNFIGCLTAAAIGLSATTALAQDFKSEKKARQGQMHLISLNLGILGKMAKGQIEYDPVQAQLAADSLVAISNIQQAPLWPAGSDNTGTDGTRALPIMWDKYDDVAADWATFGEKALVMQTAASNGAEALGPALGQVGGTCKSCHEAFRAPTN